MSGPKRNPDKLNTIGVVVVGICGAVLVYVAIVALQAFYQNDTSSIQHHADFGGMDITAKGHKADELRNISEPAANPGGNGTYRMKIEDAMKLVADDAKGDPSHLTGSKLPPATKETIPPQFGRPKIGGDTAAPPAGGAAPAGEGSAAPAGAGSAAPAGTNPAGAAGSAAATTPTGQVGGGGAAGASPTAGAAQPAAGSAQPARPNP